ncbi:MAG: DUF4294 domain-containing protein [Prevotellaceae bacterium]|jgi:hypothetical protein|nr:DUF4294 domain-containing protein [Prevotellaceae bacterium]
MKAFFACCLVGLLATPAVAVDVAESRPTLAYIAVDENGDTIPHVRLQPVYCFAKPKFKNARQERRYYREHARMVYNLKKVYPYAQLAKQKLTEMDAEFALLKDDEKAKKAYLKRMEKELFREFEQPLRKLTISQGRMLIKLVDRETGRTGYQIVKELKGGFSAFFWQSVAVIFDSSLKTQFDPEGQDKLLNQLLFLYENGLL